LKQKKRSKKLTSKERFAAVTIGGIGILLFLTALIVYDRVNGLDRRGQVPAEKPPATEESLAAVPPEAQPVQDGAAETAKAGPALEMSRLPAGEQPAARPLPTVQAASPPARAPARQMSGPAAQTPPERPRPPSPERKGGIVYVIDDAGNNLHELEPFLRFPGALTVAVLPGLPHSAQAARLIREAGKEVFLHQPMEAVGGANPGPGAIYIGMSAEETRAVLEKNVREIGPIAGMNNHQGSLVTQDEEIMKVVIEFCRENNLHFLDSRTTADTVAPKIARDAGVKIAERNIFLDNEQDRNAIRGSLEQGLGIAQRKNIAVMIGHTWSPELAGILTDSYDGLSAGGYVFFSVSEMMEGTQ
jgi:polysaccharide deacetylase 2 family uncharacterized protein YibQ